MMGSKMVAGLVGRRASALVGLLVVLTLLTTACGGSGKPKGYLDPARLEGAVRSQVNDRLQNATAEQRQEFRDAGVDPDVDRVDEVVCILNPNSKREFTCKVSFTPSGYSDSTTILVSKDGERYVGE